MGKTALVLITEGSEEIEAVVTIDVLRRGGISVDVAHVGGDAIVKCSRDVVLKADKSLKDASSSEYDLIVLPGGLGGAKAFAASDEVGKILRKQEESGRLIGAICASPALVLPEHKIGMKKSITCYPSFAQKLSETGSHQFQSEKVVIDGNLITSQGPGTSFDFALALVEKLQGQEVRNKTAQAMLL